MSDVARRDVARNVVLADWRSLQAVEREAVLQLQISTEQVEYAGPIARSVAACEAGNPSEVAGLAIRDDGAIVGWLLVKRGASAPDWVDSGAVVLSGLRIDQRRQGRGIGALALAALARWVGQHWPQASRLVLRVDEGNQAGIRAYEKAGWREIGERRMGRVGVERTMALVV